MSYPPIISPRCFCSKIRLQIEKIFLRERFDFMFGCESFMWSPRATQAWPLSVSHGRMNHFHMLNVAIFILFIKLSPVGRLIDIQEQLPLRSTVLQISRPKSGTIEGSMWFFVWLSLCACACVFICVYMWMCVCVCVCVWGGGLRNSWLYMYLCMCVTSSLCKYLCERFFCSGYLFNWYWTWRQLF